MKSKAKVVSILLCFTLMLWGCGGAQNKNPGNTSGSPSVSTSTDKPNNEKPNEVKPNVEEPKAGGAFKTISDISDKWNELHSQNEAVINAYEIPIMELVTGGLCFISGVQYDLLNLDNKDGRFEGKLMLAGWQGFVEKAGNKLTFGYDAVREKNGFSPNDKVGDKLAEKGSFDLSKEYYITEQFTERDGKKINRSYYEFKRLGDGSMISLELGGNMFDIKGNEKPTSDATYIKSGKDTYDFVIARAEKGTGFEPISFANNGDMTKDQAIAAFQKAGYTIDMTGGIKDGALYMNKGK